MPLKMTDRLDVLEERMTTLEDTVRQTFLDFRKSMMEEFAKFHTGRAEERRESPFSEESTMARKVETELRGFLSSRQSEALPTGRWRKEMGIGPKETRIFGPLNSSGQKNGYEWPNSNSGPNQIQSQVGPPNLVRSTHYGASIPSGCSTGFKTQGAGPNSSKRQSTTVIEASEEEGESNFDGGSMGLLGKVKMRIATVLMYLSDVEEGGETVFPAAKANFSSVPWWNDLSECARKGLSVKPKMGDALLFWSMRPDATLDPSSLHGMHRKARKVFDEMPERNLFNELPKELSIGPDLVSDNTVLKALCEMGSPQSVVSPFKSPSIPLELGASGGFGGQPAGIGGGDMYGGGGDFLRSISGASEVDKPIIIELDVAAMEELMGMAQMGEPLWLTTHTHDGTSIVLIEDEYIRSFPRGIGSKPTDFKCEASRETTVVIMNHVNLVEILMDVNQWSTLFVGIVSRAMTLEVLSTGLAGNYNGALQVMTCFKLWDPGSITTPTTLIGLEDVIGIVKFLRGKKFSITSATGFLAKVLIKKILRTGPDVEKVYPLIKAENKEAAIGRLRNEIMKAEVFRRLREIHGNIEVPTS